MSVVQRFESIPPLLHAPLATTTARDQEVSAGWTALAPAAHAHAVLQRIRVDGYPAAAAELTQMLARQKPSAPLYAMRALCLLHTGAHAQAAQDLQQACILAPHNAALFALQAIALADVHSPDAVRRARASLAQARALSPASPGCEPSSPYVSLASAKLAILEGRYQAALHAADAAVQQAPRCALTRSVQAEITLQLAGPAKALPLTQTSEPLALQSPHMQALGVAARAKLGATDPQALAACVERVEALGQAGAFVPYVVWAAALVAQSQTRNFEAQRLWARAPQVVVQMWLPGQVHQAAVLLGIDPPAAADALRKIPPSFAQHPSVRALRAQVMEATYRPQIARQTWARLAQDTEGAVRTEALWAQAGRPASTRALSDAERKALVELVRHAPLHAQALYQLANDALVRGQTRSAIGFAQTLLTTGDETGRAHFLLGMSGFGQTPAAHFRQFLQAPRRDAALLDEARLYIAHLAFDSAQWDEAIEQVRAMPSGALDPDAKQTLSYLESQCQQGLVLRGAEDRIATVRRMTCGDEPNKTAALKAALHDIEQTLSELDTLVTPGQMLARLTLLGQKAWLHLQLGQRKKAGACLVLARELFAQDPDHLKWPIEAERTYAALRAQRFLFVQAIIGYLLDFIKMACSVLGAQVLAAGVDYLDRLLKERIFARKDTSPQLFEF